MKKVLLPDDYNISPLALVRWVNSEYEEAIFKRTGNNKILRQNSVRSILKILSLYSGISQNDLAREVHLKGATISISLNLMQKEGLIYREASLTDKRKINVYLSSKGYDLKKELDIIVEDTEKEILSMLADNEKYELSLLLRKILANY